MFPDYCISLLCRKNHYFWVLTTIYFLVNFVKKQSVVYIKRRKENFRNEKDSITSSRRECME